MEGLLSTGPTPSSFLKYSKFIEKYLQVIPELDAPAHVGAGWEAVAADLTLCVNREPWTDW